MYIILTGSFKINRDKEISLDLIYSHIPYPLATEDYFMVLLDFIMFHHVCNSVTMVSRPKSSAYRYTRYQLFK